MALSETDLLKAGDAGLLELFRKSPPGVIPKGPLEGTGIVRWGGRRLTGSLARFVRLALWRGKVIDHEGYLSNRLTAFDVLAVLAQVYKGPSMLDDRDCIVIDYSRISLAARAVRDEMRQVGPDLYLGVVWLFGLRVGWFTLRVPERGSAPVAADEAAAGQPG
ncbi:hypothetical protein GCM10010211_36820 [Streptomyces albospinus]|uniref:Uncharacterized protein n=1 Tax=Streptomyces albospinus TaxID=285515 RepID=A0ABQ2V694_9ACTN|nr:hypothetical protein [Streptomyces albospinus]GGU68185.1 hypothetical protein GCM10010211_36820 [Streptomyces albospinus]